MASPPSARDSGSSVLCHISTCMDTIKSIASPEIERLSVSLLDLLRNDLLLRQVSPYLGVTGLLSLAATSAAFKSLVFQTPQVFQYVNLSTVGFCSKPRWYPDYDYYEGLMSTDEYYGRPLRRVFDSLGSRNILQDIRTLVLDRLCVPKTLLWYILCTEGHNIRILSLRSVGYLGDANLQSILRFLIRPSRSAGKYTSKDSLVIFLDHRCFDPYSLFVIEGSFYG